MSRKYTIRNNDKLYFVTFTIVYWLDVFIRDRYRDIFYDSVTYCQREKGLEVYAYCIMSSHVHLIIGRSGELDLSGIIRDLKAFTSRHIRKALEKDFSESRREWLLSMMKSAGSKNARNNDFQFWQQHNHPIELATNEMIDQRLHYIHANPVVAGFVDEPEAWLHSSARDYAELGAGRIEVLFV